MESGRLIVPAVVCSVILAGCGPGGWRDIHIGETSGEQIERVLGRRIEANDRYVYALAEDELSGVKKLIMASMDAGGLASGKYYWREEPYPMLGLFKKDSWEMLLETRMSPGQMQEYSSAKKHREEAALGYFGVMLFDTSRQFEHLTGVAELTRKMNQVMAIAIERYERETAGQSVSGRKGFVFDGQRYGDKCRMRLKVIDEQTGVYRLVVKGNRRDN